jgi:hypothetical protein
MLNLLLDNFNFGFSSFLGFVVFIKNDEFEEIIFELISNVGCLFNCFIIPFILISLEFCFNKSIFSFLFFGLPSPILKLYFFTI